MTAEGQNEGFHVLEDFVCEAIPAPSVPLADPANQGRNEGLLIVQEFIFEAEKVPTSQAAENPDSAALPDDIKALVQPVAAFIAGSADPRNALALFQKSVLAELGRIQAAGPE